MVVEFIERDEVSNIFSMHNLPIKCQMPYCMLLCNMCNNGYVYVYFIMVLMLNCIEVIRHEAFLSLQIQEQSNLNEIKLCC